MQRNVYFTEDQRWPSKSQRFGWLVVTGVAIFIAFQLNLHVNAPLVAFPLLVLLIFLVLAVLTVQQRLSLRIGVGGADAPEIPFVGRFWRRASRADSTPDDSVEQMPEIRITYRFKSPFSALAPSRRGARTGWIERRIPLAEVERWHAAKLPPITPFLRAGRSFPVGFQREGVAVILSDGEKITVPTRIQAALLEALSTAKVDSVRLERGTPRPVREEL